MFYYNSFLIEDMNSAYLLAWAFLFYTKVNIIKESKAKD